MIFKLFNRNGAEAPIADFTQLFWRMTYVERFYLQIWIMFYIGGKGHSVKNERYRKITLY